jgi:gliding motility-associated-like protein
VGIGTWTVISGSGTFSNASSSNSNVTAIGNGLNVYRWSVVNGSCPVIFDEVSVQTFVVPSISNAGNDQSVCATIASLNASIPSVGQGTWTLVSGNGIIQTPSSNQTQVTNLQVGSNVFRYTISNGVCPPSVDDVTISVSVAPTPNAGIDQNVCSTSATLSGNLPSGATGVWTLVSGNGAIQSSNQAVTQISNLGVGANVFQWTLNNGACPSVNDQITITRFVEPSTAVAGNDLQTCANSAQLNANVPSVGQGFWSVVSGSGNFSNPSSANASVSGLTAGDNVLRWSVSNGNCPVSSATVTITVDQNPTSASAGADQAICNTSTLLEADAPAAGTGVWTLISGSATIASPQLAGTGISAIGVGNNIFRWTVTNGSCISFDEVSISRALPPSIALAGIDQQLCSTSASLSGNTPTIGTGSWSVVSGNGDVTNSNSAITTVTNLSVGANVFTWTISNGACPSQEDQITIIRQEAPSVANAGPDQTICANQVNLAAVLPQIGTGIWSVVSGTGTLSNALLPASSVTSLSAGANVFQWTTLNGVCAASSDQVTITRVLPPSVAAAGADASVCGSSYQLQALPATVGTGIWTITSGTGTLVNASSATSNISALSTGTVGLTWTISNAPCPASSDNVVLTVSAAPPAAFAGVDLQVCGDSVFLAGTAPGTAMAEWQFIQGSGEINSPESALTAVTSLSSGTSLIQYIINNGNCFSRDTIAIESFEPITSVFAGADTTICDNVFNLNASVPATGVGFWQALSEGVGFDEPENPQSLVVLPLGESLLEWTVSNGSCPNLSDTISVTLSEPAEQAIAMADLSICAELVTLNATAPSSGLGFWDVISENAEVLDPTNPNTQLVFTEENEVVLQWVVQLGFCSSSDTVTITRPEPPFPVSAGEDQTLCTTQATLQAEPLEVGTGIWTSPNGGFFSNPSNPESGFVVPEPGIQQLIWTATNGVCAISDTIYVEFLEQPVANAGPNLFGCENDTLYLQAEFPEIGDSYWVSLSPEANLFEPFSVNSGFLAETSGNYYLLWFIENEACRDSSLLTITIYGAQDNECQGEIVEVFIPEGFSPNNDGTYDKFVIAHSSSKSVDLKVFDRWGALVFESNNYQNDWEGTSTIGTLINGNELPEGTYYYLVKIQGESETRKGYFTLWR